MPATKDDIKFKRAAREAAATSLGAGGREVTRMCTNSTRRGLLLRNVLCASAAIDLFCIAALAFSAASFAARLRY